MRTKISLAILVGLIIGGGYQSTKERAFINTGETGMTLERLVPAGSPALLDGGYQLLTDVAPEDYGVSQIGGRGQGWTWSRPGSSMASNTKRITVSGGTELTVTARRPGQ